MLDSVSILTSVSGHNYAYDRPLKLSGTVTFSGGTPVRSASCTMSPAWAERSIDFNGKYEFYFAPGQEISVWGRFFANPGDPGSINCNFRITDGLSPTVDTILDVELPTVSWSGTVADYQGNAVASPTLSAGIFGCDVYPTVDFNGAFTWPHMYKGNYSITLQKTGFTPTFTSQVINANVAGTVYNFRKPVKVSGRLTYADDGSPAFGISMRAVVAGVPEVSTSATGYWEFFPPSANFFIYAKMNFATVYCDFGFHGPSNLDADSVIDYSIVTVAWTGRVVDRFGNPVSGVRFSLYGRMCSLAPYSGADGTFSVPRTFAGPYSGSLVPPVGSSGFATTPIASFEIKSGTDSNFVIAGL